MYYYEMDTYEKKNMQINIEFYIFLDYKDLRIQRCNDKIMLKNRLMY